jgi:serine protease Do/serine protease DegQ
MKKLAFLRFRALFVLLAIMAAGCAQADIPSGMLQSKNGMPSLYPMLKHVLPAVVNVVVKEKPQPGPPNPLLSNPFFRHFFNVPKQQQPMQQHAVAIGSGVILDAKKGLIVTNSHVVKNAQKIIVRLKDNRQFTAKLLGTDPTSDIAVIKIKADNLTALPVADSSKLRVGDFVVAVGNPFGLRETVTSGIVSGLGRHGLGPTNEGSGPHYENFIQTDASINPGNSGGALVNLKGQLVAIPSEILSRSGGNIGIGFAIPSNLMMHVYHQIVKYGKVKRGRLGVYGQNLTPKLAKALGVKRNQGVVVTQVIPDSPAAKAGIQQRDVIIKVDGKPINDFSDLANAIGLRSPGSKVTITLIRNGHEKQIHAKLGNAKSVASAGGAGGGPVAHGLKGAHFGAISHSNPLYGQVQGVEVQHVQPGSPAAQAGLRPGDIITSVNRHPVHNVSELRKQASNAKQLLLHVRRGPGAMFILIQ